MNNKLRFVLSAVFTLQNLAWCANKAQEQLAGIYHIIPDNKTVEYRNAFARTYIKTITDQHEHKIEDTYKVGTSTTRQVEDERHYPAGLYYKNSDVAYSLPIASDIVYSLTTSLSGPAQRLVIWKILSGKISSDKAIKDATKKYDTQVRRGVLWGLVCGAVSGWFGRKYSYMLNGACGCMVGWALGNLIHKRNKSLLDFQYMTDEAHALLLKKMTAAGDNRVSMVSNASLVVVDVLQANVQQKQGVPHIEHFSIKPATQEDITIVQQGYHKLQGSIGYELPHVCGFKYDMSNKNEFTMMAAFKRLIGWGA